MEIYRITTTGNDLDHNYSKVSANWEFAGHTRGEDGQLMEEWTCETSSPAALEGLLNTDSQVGTYVCVEDSDA